MFSTKHNTTGHRQRLDPKRHSGGNSSASIRYQAHGTTFDAESGQVYKEKTVRAPRKQKINWINEYKTPSLVKRRHANKEGAASLFDMAKAKVARETTNLTTSHLEAIPSSIGTKLWDEVEARYGLEVLGRTPKLMIRQSPREFPYLANICFGVPRELQISIPPLLLGYQRASASSCRLLYRP